MNQQRLNSLLKLRAVHRDMCRSSLSQALSAEEILAQHRQEVVEEQAALESQRRSWAADDEPDIGNLLAAGRHQLLLANQAQQIATQAELLTAETQRRREALLAADQQVRIVEKLDERRQNSRRQAEVRREVAELDEAASQIFLRRHRESQEPRKPLS